MQSNFNLLLISPEQNYPDEAKIVAQLFSQGLKVYHLRKPHAKSEEILHFLSQLPHNFHNRIVLHSHFELTGQFNVKGIHLNEENKKRVEELSDYKIISASFHTINDLATNIVPYEYVLLSPVFDSISKSGYTSNFDLGMLTKDIAALKKQKNIPDIIALGGINAENISMIQQAGFSGAALLGAVWQSEDPVKAFLEIQTKVMPG